jgi:hypothetical protein
MTEWGLVQSVDTETLGGYVSADTATGLSVIPVEDVGDFSPTGGQISLGGVEYDYTSTDADALTVTLATPLVADANLGARIDVIPLTVVKYATVLINDDAVTARVPHSLFDRMADGIREVQEPVELEQVGGELVIRDVLGRTPTVDGSYLDSNTLPHPSDGLPPGSSPTPSARGGIRYVYLEWEPVANADPVTYDVHRSTTAGFTADSSNLVGSTESTIFFCEIDSPDYTISYYFRIIARDRDGSAAAGTEVGVMLTPITSPDIASDTIRGNHILAGELLALHLSTNFLETGSLLAGSSAGRHVKMDGDGLQTIAADGSALLKASTTEGEPLTFKGEIEAEALTVQDGLDIRGQGVVGVGANISFSAGVHTAVNAPGATVGYPMSASNLDNLYYRTAAVDWGSTYTYYLRHFFDNTVLERRNISGQDGPSYNLKQKISWGYAYGKGAAIVNDVTAGEDRLYVLIQDADAATLEPIEGSFHVRKIDVSDWTTTGPVKVADYAWTHDTGVNFFRPAIGRRFDAAGTYITAEVLPNQTQIRFRSWNSSTGALLSTATCNAPGVSGSELLNMPDKNLRGCGYGEFGMTQGAMWMVAMHDRVWFWSPTGTFITAARFNTNGSQNAFAWSAVSSEFKGYNNDDSQLTTYTEWEEESTSQTTTCWAGYTLLDTVGTAHETPVSALRSYTAKKRGQVTLSAPAIPGAGGVDDPDSVKFYIAKSATPPANSALWSQATDPATGVLTITYVNPRVASGGGATNPPTTNNFPSAAAAQATWGSLNIQGDGMIRETVGWTAYTPVWTATTTNPTNFTIAGKLKKIGRQVTIAIKVTLGASFTAGNGTYSLSLPGSYPASTTVDDIGEALWLDSSAGTAGYRSCTALVASTTTLIVVYDNGTTAQAWNHGGWPTALATGDIMRVKLTYETSVD